MKKTFASILALTTALSLASCGGNSGSTSSTGSSSSSSKTSSATSSSGSSASTPAQNAKPAPLKWLTTGDSGASPLNQQDRIMQKINETLNIELTVNIVPEGNVEKVNVAMASGDFPDVVTGAYGTSATKQWISDGIVVGLNQYLGSNPNMKKWVEEDYSWAAIDGEHYGLPFITQFSTANALIVMRKDWLDKVGMSYPTTLDEFTAVMEAFTKQDPDGNGKDDTYGLTDNKPVGQFNFVFYAMGRKNADFGMDDGGKVVPVFEDKSFKPGMEYIKSLWDSGYIDPEFMLNDNPKREEKFYQGQAGAMVAALFRHVSRHETNLQKVFPNASITYGLPPKGPDGSSGLSGQGKGGMYTSITAACKTPDRAAAFIDYMVSEEGNNLLRYGIEGVHFTKSGDTITYNEEERAKDSFSPNGWCHAMSWGSFYWPLESGFLPVTEPSRDRALETTKLATEAQVPNLVKFKTDADIEYDSTCNDIYNQYFSDMLQGKVSIDDGIQKLSTEWRAAGGDKIIAAAQAAYDANK